MAMASIKQKWRPPPAFEAVCRSPSSCIQMLSAVVKARKQQYMPPLSKNCDIVVSTSPV